MPNWPLCDNSKVIASPSLASAVMLYLPAIPFEDLEVRLPSPAIDIVDFCLALDSENRQAELRRLVVSNPGLLIFQLARFREGNGVPLESLDQLIEEGCRIDSAIESDAFAPAKPLDLLQTRSWHRCTRRPRRKRLARFVAANSDVTLSKARKLIDRICAPDMLDSLMSLKTRARSLTTEDDIDDLPVRSIWLQAARLQQLRADFEGELHHRKMLAMKQLAYGASHEINNPLANIATRSQSLMADEQSPSRRQKLAVIYAQAMRAHEMISDMMLFAHPPEIQTEWICLRDLVEQVVNELRVELSSSNIEVSIRQYPAVTSCEVDPTQLAVAIKAIIQNGIQAIGTGGQIRIQLWRRHANECAISFSDSGPGICDQISGQIFDPFYSGREAGRGLGFGLSKAWRIMQLHGGRIELDRQGDDQLFGGARFVITVPFKANAEAKSGFSGETVDVVRAA